MVRSRVMMTFVPPPVAISSYASRRLRTVLAMLGSLMRHVAISPSPVIFATGRFIAFTVHVIHTIAIESRYVEGMPDLAFVAVLAENPDFAVFRASVFLL